MLLGMAGRQAIWSCAIASVTGTKGKGARVSSKARSLHRHSLLLRTLTSLRHQPSPCHKSSLQYNIQHDRSQRKPRSPSPIACMPLYQLGGWEPPCAITLSLELSPGGKACCSIAHSCSMLQHGRSRPVRSVPIAVLAMAPSTHHMHLPIPISLGTAPLSQQTGGPNIGGPNRGLSPCPNHRMGGEPHCVITLYVELSPCGKAWVRPP